MKRVVFILVLGLGGLSLGGCYHRVVYSRGLGGMGTDVQEPYRSDTAADRTVDGWFGPPEKTFKGADNMPLKGHSQWTTDSNGGK